MTIAAIETEVLYLIFLLTGFKKEKNLIVREKGSLRGKKNAEIIWKMCRERGYNKQLISSRQNAEFN